MKPFRVERVRPVAAALVFLLILIPSASAQNLQVEGFEAGDVNTSFHSNEICFNNSQLDKCLAPKKVFVPSVLEDDLDLFSYTLQTYNESGWPGVAAQLYLRIQYGGRYSSDYPTSNLSTSVFDCFSFSQIGHCHDPSE